MKWSTICSHKDRLLIEISNHIFMTLSNFKFFGTIKEQNLVAIKKVEKLSEGIANRFIYVLRNTHMYIV